MDRQTSSKRDKEGKSYLFVCTYNSIRSPMAEAMLRDLATRSGWDMRVQSAGVQAQLTDGFAIAVMADIGLDMSEHEGQSLDDVDLDQIDHIISLSEPARMFLMHYTAGRDVTLQHWATEEPQLPDTASREEQKAHLARVRDSLMARIKAQFR